MLYVNESDKYTIKENLEFEMDDCHIDGVYGNYIEIVVKPGKERLLKIIQDEDAQSFNATIKNLYYVVE